MHRLDGSQQFFFFLQPFLLALDAHGHDFLKELLFVGHEFVQRRVNQTDDDRIAIHGFEQAIEVLTLVRQQFIQRRGALFTALRQDHALDDGQTFRLEEHVLGTTEADALGAV